MIPQALQTKLRQLKLSGMVETLELRAEQSTARQLTPLEFFAFSRVCIRGASTKIGA